MKVILLERVERLGSLGDTVTVKDGFARNFLLPRSKALRATAANLQVFEAQKAQIVARNDKDRELAEKAGEALDGTSYILVRQAGESGQLYGSVSARDLAEALEAEGHKVPKNQIVLDRPIKTIGLNDVKIALHPEVSVTIQVNVARSPEEAEMQAQGKDVLAEMFEQDVSGFTEERIEGLEPGEIAPEPAEAPAAEATESEASDEA